MKISLLNSRADNKPRTEELSDEDLGDLFSSHQHRFSKDGMAFIPAEFVRSGTRLQSDISALHGFVLDFDDGHYRLEDIKERLGGLDVHYWTTHSHSEDKRKYRAFIPYKSPVSPENHGGIYEHFFKLFDGHIDVRSSTLNQLWYLPSCPSDASHLAITEHQEGEKFDAAAFKPVQKTQTFEDWDASSVVKPSRDWEADAPEGGRYDTLNALAWKLLNDDRTPSLESIWKELCAFNEQKCNPPHETKELERIMKQAVNEFRRKNQGQFALQYAAASVEQVNDLAAKEKGNIFTPFGDLSADVKPVDWLIKGILEKDSLAMMAGDPGAGKSFIALDMAICIASGKEYHGHKVSQGAVFYCAAEGRNGLGRRVKAWEIVNQASTKNVPVFSSTRAIQVLQRIKDASSVEVFAEAIAEVSDATGQPPALVVLDTFGRSLGPEGDENDAADCNSFFERLDDLIRRRFKCAVMIVHHNGKQSGQYRGSSALRGAVDTELSVEKADGCSKLSCEKMKEAEPFAPKYFKLEVADIGVCDPDTLERETSVAPVETAPIKGADDKDVLCMNGDKIAISITAALEAIGEGITQVDLCDKLNLSRDYTRTKVVKPLEGKGFIKKLGQTILLTDEGKEFLIKGDFDEAQ